jgi:hypothetical protein
MRAGTVIYLIGGIAAVLGVLWWVFPQPSAPASVGLGRLEARYRTELPELFAAAGLRDDPAKCNYSAKSLTLACTVPMSSESGLRSVLGKSGWAPSQTQSQTFLFTKGRDIASFQCFRQSDSHCEFRLTYSMRANGA